MWKRQRYESQIIKGSKGKIKFGLTPRERISGLTLPKEVSEDLAYFCGVLAGDGSISYREAKKQYEVHCAGNPKDEVEYYNELIIPLIKQLFNLNIKPKYFNGNKIYGFCICSKNLVRFLTEYVGLPLGKKYSSLRIPGLFLNDERFIRSFISGLADTDFHLRIAKGYYPVITGVSKSKKFIKDIKGFLEKDGFKCNSYVRKQHDKRFKKDSITYSLELNGPNQFFPWIKKIGFRHPKVKPKVSVISKYYKSVIPTKL